jgi:glycosyltransferase involved in cell wall biosynthesis
MNILVVNWQDIKNPLAGGAEVHLHQVFERIAAMGHKVTLFCSAFPGAPPEEDLNGLRVIRRGGRSFFNFHFLATYRSLLQPMGFDVVVDDMNKIPFFTPSVVREPVYGVTHHLFGRSIFLETNPLLASYVFLMERMAVLSYRRRRIPFIVGSPSTHAELIGEGFPASDVALIHYGVDHRRHVPAIAEKGGAPLIGYFGRLKKYKSIDHFLRALPAVRTAVPGVKAVVVGEGDDRARLEGITASLGLGDMVEFTGFVPEERKVELLQRMWFAVAPSSKEGWGLTVVEANACGTPVIASDVQGLRDAVKEGETGLLYPYGDVEGLTAKILLLLTDTALRARLTANAILWSKEFDWDKAARDTVTLLRRRASAAAR